MKWGQGNKGSRRSGQAMLIAVLSLGGAILGATTVAGLLTLYQIRATTDTENSAKAIFAADAGTEWALFSYYCGSDGRCPGTAPSFPGSGAQLTLNCYGNTGATGAAIPCSNASTTVGISVGISNSSERAFFVGIANASSTAYP